MKVTRLLATLVAIMLGISIIRTGNGAEPIKTGEILEITSSIDINFTKTMTTITKTKDKFTKFDFVGGTLEAIRLPFSIIGDILNFLASVFEVIQRLLGYNW